MKRDIVSVGEYYHVFNRGVNKQVIFNDKNDWNRFVFLLMFFQSPVKFQNIGRLSSLFSKSLNVQHPVLNIEAENVAKNRYVELVCFCMMPNHFHMVIKEEKEGGIAKYMQRVLNGYAKYYNTKYQKSGHLFQGPYKSVHINSNNQLLHTSAYIHRNPRELSTHKGKENNYVFSSYTDYIKENRWGSLLSTSIITDQFKSKKEYYEFVASSPSKVLEEELKID